MAKDVDLADYPTKYTVVTSILDSCIMSLMTKESSFVVEPAGASRGVGGCRLLPPGYTFNGRQEHREIVIAYPDIKSSHSGPHKSITFEDSMKSTVKWKRQNYRIRLESMR